MGEIDCQSTDKCGPHTSQNKAKRQNIDNENPNTSEPIFARVRQHFNPLNRE